MFEFIGACVVFYGAFKLGNKFKSLTEMKDAIVNKIKGD